MGRKTDGTIIWFISRECSPTRAFNVYTKDQTVHNERHSFTYADDLCILTQRSTFMTGTFLDIKKNFRYGITIQYS